MSNITLQTDNPMTATCVPNSFIDHYMVKASGEYVKIYLYLLRCINGNRGELSISQMADKFEYTEKDIRRALNYWEKKNLLHLEYNAEGELSGICFTDFSSSEECSSKASPASHALRENFSVLPNGHDKRVYSAKEIESFKNNEDVRTLFFIAERYMCHPLAAKDIQTILYWYNTLGFSSELIEYLIEYCVEKGHSDFRYMDKVALSWANMEIKTPEQAKQASITHNQAYHTVIKSLGINNRSLIPYEMDFIEKWIKEYHFTIDIIAEACKRTVQSIHQPSFEYTDKILCSWKDSNVRCLEDISTLDATYKKARNSSAPKSMDNKFNNFSQRNYNYDQLEQQLLMADSKQI